MGTSVKKKAPVKIKQVEKKKAPAKTIKAKPNQTKTPAQKKAAKPKVTKRVIKVEPKPEPKMEVVAKDAPQVTKGRKGKVVTEPQKPLVVQKRVPFVKRPADTVKKYVSTLESASKERYSDAELKEFKAIIDAKLDDARKDYDLLKATLANTSSNGTDDTYVAFKGMEDGNEVLSREETAQLAARQEKFIKHLEDALLRIRNKTYGICTVTGRLISKERLRLVPHATKSVEAKLQMGDRETRPAIRA